MTDENTLEVDLEQEEPIMESNDLPVILPIDEVPKKRKPRKKTMPTPPHIVERNRKIAAEHKRKNAENKAKLKEYESLKKGIMTKDDAEKLLNEKLGKIEQIIVETSKKQVQVPNILPTIKEESSGYSSETYRRTNDRFKRMEPTSPMSERFRRW